MAASAEPLLLPHDRVIQLFSDRWERSALCSSIVRWSGRASISRAPESYGLEPEGRTRRCASERTPQSSRDSHSPSPRRCISRDGPDRIELPLGGQEEALFTRPQQSVACPDFEQSHISQESPSDPQLTSQEARASEPQLPGALSASSASLPLSELSPIAGTPAVAVSGVAADLQAWDIPLTDDLLTLVFTTLSPHDLSQAAQVSRRWHELASAPSLHALCFTKAWGLSRVTGSPSRTQFWHLRKPPFVLLHKLRPSDTLARVAVFYGCQLLDLRRSNNMMSDHAIHTRRQLVVPVCQAVIQKCTESAGVQESDPEQLQHPVQQQQEDQQQEDQQHQEHTPNQQRASLEQFLKLWLRGKVCSIQFDAFAKRDVAVVHWSSDELADDAAPADDDLDETSLRSKAHRAEEARAKVVKLLMKAHGVDEATAAYYLQQSGGDVRAASHDLRGDLQWEQSRHFSGRH